MAKRKREEESVCHSDVSMMTFADYSKKGLRNGHASVSQTRPAVCGGCGRGEVVHRLGAQQRGYPSAVEVQCAERTNGETIIRRAERNGRRSTPCMAHIRRPVCAPPPVVCRALCTCWSWVAWTHTDPERPLNDRAPRLLILLETLFLSRSLSLSSAALLPRSFFLSCFLSFAFSPSPPPKHSISPEIKSMSSFCSSSYEGWVLLRCLS